MKNIFKLFAIVALGLFATSCANDLTNDLQVSGGEVEVSFTTGVPSRAISDGSQATKLYVQAYAVQGTNLKKAASAEADVVDLKATVNLKFVQGMTYKVVFWAQADGAYAPDWGDNGATVAMDYTEANAESQDAFYAVHEFTVNGPATHDVKLYRPFAQLNVATTDLAEAQSLGFELAGVEVVTKAYTSLDLISGEASDLADVVFTYTTDNGSLPTSEKLNGNDWLSYNYLLVSSANQTLDEVKVTISSKYGNAREITEYNVPVKRNYRTNLVGALLTTTNGFNVELLPAIEDIPGYPTAKDQLISVATNGGTLTLTEDIVLDSTLTIASNVVLNLNGKTVSSAGEDENGNKYATLTVADGVTATISGGEVKSTGKDAGSAIINNGTLYLDGVTIEGSQNGADDGDHTTYPGYPINNYGELLVIKNSTITGYHGIISCNAAGEVTVDNCTFNKMNDDGQDEPSHIFYVAHEDAKVTVNSGTFTHNGPSWGRFAWVSKGSLTINGGDFSVASGVQYVSGATATSAGVVVINGGSFNLLPQTYKVTTGSLTVKGGTYTEDPSALLGAGYAAVQNDEGMYVVTNNTASIAGHDVGALRTALSNGAYATMQGNMTAHAELASGYGSTCFLQTNGGAIDGNGYWMYAYAASSNGIDTNYDSAITTTGGTIKNLVVWYAVRAILINSGANTSKVYLDNVTVAADRSVAYAIFADSGSGKGLEATNCKLYSQVSYSANLGDAKFVGCEFGPNTKYTQCHGLNAYSATEFVNCEFKSGYEVYAGAACSFKNCTLDGVALTSANIGDLVINETLANATIK